MDSDDNVELTSTEDKSRSEIQNQFTRKYVLLPPICLLFAATNLTGTVLQNQILYQTCTVTLGYNESDCSLLGTSNVSKHTQDIETEVQPFAAEIFMARSLMESIMPALVSLFIGPWSDKFGRKPVILAVFTGYCLVYGLSALVSFISTTQMVNPWFYILPVIPISLCGGSCALTTGIFCYVADMTTIKERAVAMALLEASIYIGLMIGDVSSSYLLKATSPTIVFFISAALVIISIVYIFFVLKESVKIDEENKTSKIRGLFKFELVKDMFRVCFERRSNYDRTIIWLLISTLTITVFVWSGSSNVYFLFVREKFEWTIKDYTTYSATAILIQVLGNVLGMLILRKILGFSIISLALISYASCVIEAVIKATAVYPWHLYLAISTSILKGIGSPLCRSMLATVVPKTDIGKVFSLTTSLESITPLGASPLYTFFYSKTLSVYPGAFNFLNTGFFFMCFVFLSIVFGIEFRYPRTTYGPIGS